MSKSDKKSDDILISPEAKVMLIHAEIRRDLKDKNLIPLYTALFDNDTLGKLVAEKFIHTLAVKKEEKLKLGRFTFYFIERSGNLYAGDTRVLAVGTKASRAFWREVRKKFDDGLIHDPLEKEYPVSAGNSNSESRTFRTVKASDQQCSEIVDSEDQDSTETS